MKKLFLIWLVVLLTLVPYASYYLLFKAEMSQYPILIIFILFWIFGYWAILSPLMSAYKVRRLIKQLQSVKSMAHLKELFEQSDTEDSVIQTIATENGITEFIARRVFNALKEQLFRDNNSGMSA